MPGLVPSLIDGGGFAAALLVVAVVAVGCDIRDEAPRPPNAQALLGAGITSTDRTAPLIEYVGGYEAGRQRAAAEDRPLLLVCTAGWCRFSADLAQRTLRDPRLVSLSRRAVCVLLDADRDAETCRAFGVRAFPTLLVLDPAGSERLRVTGRSSAAELASALERALEPRRLATAPGDDAVFRPL
ncbi:MAG: thioredoxin family protein [Planctomycetia bacterium]